eukprot:scaffold420745_cov39-Prasinocladus_malaysianus.AAC.2
MITMSCLMTGAQALLQYFTNTSSVAINQSISVHVVVCCHSCNAGLFDKSYMFDVTIHQLCNIIFCQPNLLNLFCSHLSGQFEAIVPSLYNTSLIHYEWTNSHAGVLSAAEPRSNNFDPDTCHLTKG